MVPTNSDKIVHVQLDGLSESEACSEVHNVDFKAMLALKTNKPNFREQLHHYIMQRNSRP